MSNPEFFGGQLLPASQVQDLGEYGTWTPELGASTTAPTLSNNATHVTDGIYHRNGRLITLWFNITFGTAGVSAGSGTYRIQNLPFGIDTLGAGMAAGGNVFGIDSSPSARYVFVPRVQSSTQFTLVRPIETATSPEVTNAVPITWAASDSIRGTIVYIGTP